MVVLSKVIKHKQSWRDCTLFFEKLKEVYKNEFDKRKPRKMYSLWNLH